MEHQQISPVNGGAKSSARVVLDLDGGWRFVKRHTRRWFLGRGAPPDAEDVWLPHCWNARDGFKKGVAYYRGGGTYWRALEIPARPGEGAWRLRSEGFYGTGDLWLDGRRLALLDGEYLGFTCPIPPAIAGKGGGRLAIRLTNRCSRSVLPGLALPDFLLYGGLAGHMVLEWLPARHIADHPRLDCRLLDDGSAQVEVTAETTAAGARLTGEALAPSGAVVAQAETQATGGPARLQFHIANPALWALESPQLYTLQLTLRDGDKTLDIAAVRFGVRRAEFRPDAGFFLNGRRVELRGVNRHESMPGFGNALPDALHRADAALIRAAGLNFVRLSHYPQHPSFLNACDELGVLVYAELASWKSVRGGRWLRNALRQFARLIVRDRHHPSVIMWGMGNEGRHRDAYLRLRAVARDLDPARPVCYAENHLHRAVRARTTGIPDVWGCNYEVEAAAAGRDAARLRCVLVTESSNNPHHARGVPGREAARIRQLAENLAQMETLPYVAGFALWSFNDYGTFRKKRYRRHCGCVDAWREPKLAYAFLQARFGRAPVLEVLIGAERELHVVTNSARIRLARAGRFVGEWPVGGGYAVIEAPPGDGPLALTALAADGNAIRRRILNPAGPAERWQVEVPADFGPWRDGRLLLCAITARDTQGRVDMQWHGEATLAVTNGTACFAYPEPVVEVAAGTGRIYVITGPAGASVSVTGGSLQPCAIMLPASSLP